MNSTGEHRDPHQTKLIQICASQNDLFALDSEGTVYQYDFDAKTWDTLAAHRAHRAPRHERG